MTIFFFLKRYLEITVEFSCLLQTLMEQSVLYFFLIIYLFVREVDNFFQKTIFNVSVNSLK